MMSIQSQEITTQGDLPQARFGHSLTLISKAKAILFGGATGDSGKFIITNDSYLFNLQSSRFTKLTQTGQLPSQRAAHSAVSLDQNQIAVYGGAASGGSGLSTDDLFVMDLQKNDTNANWMILGVQSQTPGKRYGHTMIFQKPYLIVFGGNTGNVAVNDVWILNIEKSPFQWVRQDNEGEVPSPRVYHAAGLCTTGPASGMMVIFGGRTQDQTPLNDCWGLRRH